MTYPSNSDSVAQDQIRAFVDRILRLKEEAKAINGDIREVYAEAKGNGFDKTALGKLVNYVEKRNAGAADLAEAEAIFNLYLSAYDGASGTLVATHTHEAVTVPHGEITQHQQRKSGDAVPIGAAADANAGGENVAAATSTQDTEILDIDDGKSRDGGLAPISAVEPGAPIPIANSGFPPSAGANDDRGGAVSSPVSASVITHADRSRPHPFCKDPEDCGVEASWNHMCGSCHRTMEKALRDGAAA